MKMPKFGAKCALFGYFLARILKNYCRIWNQHLRISVIVKFCEETKIPKFGTKNDLLGIFDQECVIWVFLGKNVLKNYCHIWNQCPQICLFEKFHAKTKMPKFGTKNTLFGYFWAGIWKRYYHIWNQHSRRICLIAKYREIMKTPKIGIKSALFGYFWARILKNYCHIWNQHLRISLIAKFFEETKMFKIGTNSALFWYFWPKVPYFGYFWERILKKLLSYLKWLPSNLSICKISRKNKNAKIWDQKCLILVFFSWSLKTVLSYLKSAPSNLSNCKILWKNKNA